MRQSKLRAEGQTATRSDTVMLMLEEAMERAKKDIIDKFDKIESKENYSMITFGNAIVDVNDISIDCDENFAKLFDIYIDHSSNTEGNKTISFHIEEDNNNEGEEEVEIDYVENEKGVIEAVKKKRILTENYSELQRKRFRQIIEGTYYFDPNPKIPGETHIETMLRLSLSDSEPKKEVHLLNRLRCFDESITLYKSRQFLLEHPAKRLLLRYLEATKTEEILIQDLKKHYKLKRNHEKIASFLISLVVSDFERGILVRERRLIESELDIGLRMWIDKHFQACVTSVDDQLQRKLITVDMPEEEVLDLQMFNVKTNLIRFGTQVSNIVDSIDLLKKKSKRVFISFQMLFKKYKYMEYLKCKKFKGWTPPLVISVADRHNWLLRLNASLNLPEIDIDEDKDGDMNNDDDNNPRDKNQDIDRDNAQKLMKYEEIRSICTEFLSIATSDAILIISENFIPKFKKTISVVSEMNVKGRNVFTGRGHDDMIELELDILDEGEVPGSGSAGRIEDTVR